MAALFLRLEAVGIFTELGARMATPAYIPIYTTTLAASAPAVFMANLPQNYSELILIIDANQGAISANANAYINADKGANYSRVRVYGNGSAGYSDVSYTRSDLGSIFIGSSNQNGLSITNFMNYSSTSQHKTVVTRVNSESYVSLQIYAWENTSAMTSLEIASATANDFAAGSTFSLIGILGTE